MAYAPKLKTIPKTFHSNQPFELAIIEGITTKRDRIKNIVPIIIQNPFRNLPKEVYNVQKSIILLIAFHSI